MGDLLALPLADLFAGVALLVSVGSIALMRRSRALIAEDTADRKAFSAARRQWAEAFAQAASYYEELGSWKRAHEECEEDRRALRVRIEAIESNCVACGLRRRDAG